MSDKPLFADPPKKPSEKGLFDKPTKSTKKPASIFDEPSKVETPKPAKKDGSTSIFDNGSAGSKSEKSTPKDSKKPTDPKKRKKILSIVLACFGSAILLCGGVVGAVYAIWYHSDEGVLSSAIDHLFSTRDADVIIDGNIKTEDVGDEALNIGFVLDLLTKDKDAEMGFSLDAQVPETNWIPGSTQYSCGDRKYSSSSEARADCGWDYDYDYASGHYEYSSTNFSITADAIIKGSDYFVKAGFESIIEMLGGEATNLEGLEDYDGEWIRLSQEYLEETLESSIDYDSTELQTCTDGISSRYPNIGKDIYKLAIREDGGIIKASSNGTRGDVTTYDLSLSTNPEDYATFLDNLYHLSIVSDSIDCYIDVIESSMEDNIYSSVVNRQSIDKMYSQLLLTVRRADKDDFAEAIEEYFTEATLSVNRSSRQIENLTVILADETTLDLNFKTDTRDGKAIEAPAKYKNIEGIVD